MLRWLQVARVGEIANRQWKLISVNGSDIAAFNLNGAYFAVDDVFTHLRSDQSAGSLESDGLMYRWHASEYG